MSRFLTKCYIYVEEQGILMLIVQRFINNWLRFYNNRFLQLLKGYFD